MKTLRFLIGIISIILFAIITFQTCAADISSLLKENDSTGNSSGIFLALCLLIAGIIELAFRHTKNGTILSALFYAAGAFFAIGESITFPGLMIWSLLSFIFSGIFICDGLKQKNQR